MIRLRAAIEHVTGCGLGSVMLLALACVGVVASASEAATLAVGDPSVGWYVGTGTVGAVAAEAIRRCLALADRWTHLIERAQRDGLPPVRVKVEGDECPDRLRARAEAIERQHIERGEETIRRGGSLSDDHRLLGGEIARLRERIESEVNRGS